MSGEVKMNRIKAQNKGVMGLLGEVVNPEVLHPRVSKLKTTAQNRVEFRNLMDTMSTLGAHCRANGFDPTRTFQHVANIDNEIWVLILDMFAKYDPVTGELMDDGLLYRFDESTKALKLNKDFFYALISHLEASGYPCDMRGKIKLA